MRTVLAVLRKDLLLELRTLETLPAMVLFSVATFVIFHFGLGRATLRGQLAAGVLTVTLLFAAMLAINRLFVHEREQGAGEDRGRDQRIADRGPVGDVGPVGHRDHVAGLAALHVLGVNLRGPLQAGIQDLLGREL